jgi:hypothetical protein
MPIKRKISKLKVKKTRRNCSPCIAALNPGKRKNPKLEKYYVYDDITDPYAQTSEHDSYKEAVKIVRDLQKKGLKNARIVGPGAMPEDVSYPFIYK